jgi:hypothetical protein
LGLKILFLCVPKLTVWGWISNLIREGDALKIGETAGKV